VNQHWQRNNTTKKQLLTNGQVPNSVALSPARTFDIYGNNAPSAGRSLNKFNASLPKWTITGTPVFLRVKLIVLFCQSTSSPSVIEAFVEGFVIGVHTLAREGYL
jgi:hypothetical protein